jgi:multidrug efflux pump subunit AcrA (membrane-fusion protein)
MRYPITLMFLLAFPGVISPLEAQAPRLNPGDIEVECQFSAEEKIDVASQEEGILRKMPVEEGKTVSAKDLLAQIDDDIPQMQLKVAENELNVAREEAENDINKRFAQKSAEVAWAEYQKALDSNRRMKNSVAEIEVMRLRLEYEKMALSIENAERDLRIAKLKYNVSEAKRDAAKVDVARRKIFSPSEGIVVELNRRVGEWLQKGSQVLRLVRMDPLRAEGKLELSKVSPLDVDGRKVTVIVELTGKQTMSFPGEITFVDPVVNYGKYIVRAKIANRKENGQWLLRDGLTGKMIIHLK